MPTGLHIAPDYLVIISFQEVYDFLTRVWKSYPGTVGKYSNDLTAKL